MSLKKTALVGLFWSFAQQFSLQAIGFIVSIILARLVLPEEFGLIGLLTVFVAIGTTLINAGLSASLIRTTNPDQRDYSTVFFINLVGSVLIYLIMFFCAPLIAMFFNQEVLTLIIRVYTLSFIINAFSGIQSTRLIKEMNFKIQMFIQVPSVILGAIIGIYLAYQGYGVWSLVWMNLAQSLISSVQLWLFSGWRPDFFFDKERFKVHFNFGYKLLLSGLLDSIFINIYSIVIGKFFNVSQVGYYTRAMSVRQLPVSNISTALNNVTYPIFASIKDDNMKLKSAYKKLMQQVLFWIAPVLISLCVLAEPFFRLLFTEKWLPAVPYFQLLCVGGIMFPLQSYNLNILKVKGRTDLFFKLEVIKKAIVVIGLVVAIPYGIFGLLYFQIVATFLAYFINTRYSGKLLDYSMMQQIRDIIPILLLAILVGLITWRLDVVILKALNYSDLLQLLAMMCIYWVLYLSMSLIFKLAPALEFKQLLLKK